MYCITKLLEFIYLINSDTYCCKFYINVICISLFSGLVYYVLDYIIQTHRRSMEWEWNLDDIPSIHHSEIRELQCFYWFTAIEFRWKMSLFFNMMIGLLPLTFIKDLSLCEKECLKVDVVHRLEWLLVYHMLWNLFVIGFFACSMLQLYIHFSLKSKFL